MKPIPWKMSSSSICTRAMGWMQPTLWSMPGRVTSSLAAGPAAPPATRPWAASVGPGDLGLGEGLQLVEPLAELAALVRREAAEVGALRQSRDEPLAAQEADADLLDCLGRGGLGQLCRQLLADLLELRLDLVHGLFTLHQDTGEETCRAFRGREDTCLSPPVRRSARRRSRATIRRRNRKDNRKLNAPGDPGNRDPCPPRYVRAYR